MASEELLKAIQKRWEEVCSTLPQLGDQLATLRIVSLDPIPPADKRGRRRAEGWKMSWEGTVLKEWANLGKKIMHGGIAAWLMGNCTSATVGALHTPTFWGLPMYTGAALNMEVAFLQPVPIGARIRITTEVLRLSEKLANIKFDITDPDTGRPYITGHQLKAWRSSSPKAKL